MQRVKPENAALVLARNLNQASTFLTNKIKQNGK